MGRKNSFFSLKSASLRTNRGMTLSEVLVVIAILGILILLAAFFIRPIFQIGKAKDAERKSDLKKLATVLEDYATDHKCYPNETSGLNVLAPNYIPQIPTDPKTKQSYTYVCSNDGDCSNGAGCTKFAIFTTLESETGTSYSQGNYVVTSPNYSLAPGSEDGCYTCINGSCMRINYSYCFDPEICVGYPKWINRNCSGEGCCPKDSNGNSVCANNDNNCSL